MIASQHRNGFQNNNNIAQCYQNILSHASYILASSLIMKSWYTARKEYQFKKLVEEKEEKKCKNCEKCQCGKDNRGFEAAKEKNAKK